MGHARPSLGRGPFTANQIRSGDRFELSHGNAVVCEPTGRAGAQKTAFGAEVIETDPAVDAAGVDAGFALTADTLRAPDIAVGAITDEPGWVQGQAPVLAVEYAGSGQDEGELTAKITELLAHGTQLLWVVRVAGSRCVEVYRPGREVEIRMPGEVLEAQGILHNPVPVEALFERDAAHEHTLRNLLQRRGYEDIGEIREEGRLLALQDTLLRILEARGVGLVDSQRREVLECRDCAVLQAWIKSAATAHAASEIFCDSASDP